MLFRSERRLNVAVTRARAKVILLTSMPVKDVSDWLAAGRLPDKPRDYLQAYLDYAAKVSAGDVEAARLGQARLGAEVRRAWGEEDTEDGFTASIAAYIRELGYEPIATRDDDAFRLDFAIEDPRTGLFAIGIECDAPRHPLLARARGARDLATERPAAVYPADPPRIIECLVQSRRRRTRPVAWRRPSGPGRGGNSMSGPKVVRIVTRQEIEAICRGHVRDVETAVEAVARVAQRHGRLEGAMQDELTRQNAVMASLFQAENWTDIQKRAPITIANLQAYADRIRAEVIAAAAAERARGRRLAEGARTLVAALDRAGQPVAAGLRAAVQTATAATPAELAEVEARINEGMRQLAAVSATGSLLSDAALGLAGRLGTGLAEQSPEAWLAQMAPASPRDTRLDAALAELHIFADGDTLATFERRARNIASHDETQRALLTDSMILEAGRLAAQRRAQEQLAFRLRQARASLSSLLPADAKALTVRIDTALATAEGSDGAALCEEAAAIVDRESKALAAQARREAVLGGLSALGYEIRGGMAAAWAKDGRVIVRKPGTQDYGVELGAPGDASRLQVRLVGSDRPVSARGAERDRDHEVSWCSEFEALQVSVAAAGGHVVIERAIAAGTQPVKTVTFAEQAPIDERSEVRSSSRVLR